MWRSNQYSELGLQFLLTAADKVSLAGAAVACFGSANAEPSGKWSQRGIDTSSRLLQHKKLAAFSLAKTAKRPAFSLISFLGLVFLIRLSCSNGRVPNAPRSATETITLGKLRCFSLLARRRAICEPEHESWRCRRSPYGVGSRIGSSSSQSSLSSCRCTTHKRS